MSRTRWGTFLAKELARLSPVVLVGCGANPAPQPQPPPIQPTTTVAVQAKPPPPPEEVPDPKDAKKGLSAWVRFGKVSATKEDYKATNQRVIPFGRGIITTMELRAPYGKTDSSCLMAGHNRNDCRFFMAAPWSSPKPRSFYRGVIPEGQEGTWTSLLHQENEWSSYFPGDDVVYAFRNSDHLVIDTINEKGEVKLFFEDKQSPPLTAGKVLPTAKGILLIGEDQNLSGELSAIPLQPIPEEPHWKRGPEHSFGTRFTSPWGTAQEARYIVSSHKKAGYGNWDAVTLLDKKTGKPGNDVVVAWTEVHPPAKYSPRGKKPHKVKGASKNGCGTPSRPLYDGSVRHTPHLTTLTDRGTKKSDIQIQIPNSKEDLSEPPTMRLVATEHGFQLNGIAYSASGFQDRNAAHQPPPPPDTVFKNPVLQIPPLQKIITADYDEKSNRGVVVYGQEDKNYWMMFTALGQAGGEPQLLHDLKFSTYNHPELFSGYDQWFLYDTTKETVHVLLGGHAGKKIEIKRDTIKMPGKLRTWFFPKDKDHIMVIGVGVPSAKYREELKGIPPSRANRYQTLELMMYSEIDLNAKEASEWKLIPDWLITPKPDKDDPPSGASKGADDSEEMNKKGERIAYVKDIFQKKDGTLQVIGRDPKSVWFELSYNPAKKKWQKTKELETKLHSYSGNIYTVWKDKVLVTEEKGRKDFLWLTKNKIWVKEKDDPKATKQAPKEVKKKAKRRERLYSRSVALNGPLYQSDNLIPSSPGALIPIDDDDTDFDPNCPMAFATGKNRMVFLCTEAPTEKDPGAVLGARVLRY
jgi:hypothetical protein